MSDATTTDVQQQFDVDTMHKLIRDSQAMVDRSISPASFIASPSRSHEAQVPVAAKPEALLEQATQQATSASAVQSSAAIVLAPSSLPGRPSVAPLAAAPPMVPTPLPATRPTQQPHSPALAPVAKPVSPGAVTPVAAPLPRRQSPTSPVDDVR